MKKQTWSLAIIGTILTVGFGARFLTSDDSAAVSPYRTGVLMTGSVESTVTSTGRVTAVQSVAVGTQVSGQVMQLYADYNDKVKKGQLLARIDPMLQEQSLRNAEASLGRVKAAMEQAERDFERTKLLYEQQIVTEAEFDQARYNVTVARTNLTSADVSLEQAARNLAYTEIYSPIDGVVVERNVEPGQTVAASMSAPQLYLLATDLSRVEILASVDESDIGSITAGMPVRFTVSAYPNDSFEGEIRQVRLSSATQENVVSYTAVITVDNASLRLVPGMTAEVDFIVERAADVFLVPNAALRFRPTDEMIAQLTDPAMVALLNGGGAEGRPAGRAEFTDGPVDGRAGGEGRGEGNSVEVATAPVKSEGPFVLGGGAAANPTPTTSARLWFLKDGKLGVMEVRAGISDGMMTEISGAGLVDGLEILAGLAPVDAAAPQAASNPFQGSQMPGGGGGFGPPVGGFGPPR